MNKLIAILVLVAVAVSVASATVGYRSHYYLGYPHHQYGVGYGPSYRSYSYQAGIVPSYQPYYQPYYNNYYGPSYYPAPYPFVAKA